VAEAIPVNLTDTVGTPVAPQAAPEAAVLKRIVVS
jgi:hypothetical protein